MFARLFMIFAVALSSAAHATTLTSVHLTDKIGSNGRGNINLLTNVNKEQLEAFRRDNATRETTPRHFLSFAVDVNEAAKGLEKSSTQAVTVQTATLTVVRPSGTKVYSDFMTRTSALLRPHGSTTRQKYYTLLGESGSSRISASNSFQNLFDSTLNIFVPDSLSDVTSATLEIRLLDVNKNVGEPESFYDYSGGFEELALVVSTDASYLNTTLVQTAAFATQAPGVETTALVELTEEPTVQTAQTVANWSYFPSATEWYFAAYEDNYPVTGDYDFNDLVVGYRYRYGLSSAGEVLRIEGEAYILARGAAYSHDWNMRFDLPADTAGSISCSILKPDETTAVPCPSQGAFTGAVQLVGFRDTRSLMPDGGHSPYPWAVNTVRGQTFRQGPRLSFSITTSAVSPGSIGPIQPWLKVRGTAHDIDPSKKDRNGFPFALQLPSGWKPAAENVDLGLAYPELADFIRSGGSLNRTWYLKPNPELVVPLAANWSW
jgi:hypothetical protein